MVDVAALVAKARAELAVEKVSEVAVVLGGEQVTVGVSKVSPDVWDELVVAAPMRPGVEGDAMVGYNPRQLAAAYPGMSIDGEVLSVEAWGEVYAVLDSVWRNSLELTIWGVNVNEQLVALRELGKALSGKE